MTDIVERSEPYQLADSLLEMAQEVELGKLQLTVPLAAFLRECADRINRQDLEVKVMHDEIERLRAENERLRAALRLAVEYDGWHYAGAPAIWLPEAEAALGTANTAANTADSSTNENDAKH